MADDPKSPLQSALPPAIVVGSTAAASRRMTPGRALRRIGFFALVAAIVLYAVFPFYYAILTSLKSGSELFRVDYFPFKWEFGNYTAVFRGQPFGTNILNSLIVAVAVVALSLFLGVTAAFALARIQFRGRSALLVTTGLLAFIAAWNEFLFALTFTLTNDKRTVPVGIAVMSGASAHETPWGNIMAASVIVTVPLVILVLIFQRRIVSGLTAGAVKG